MNQPPGGNGPNGSGNSPFVGYPPQGGYGAPDQVPTGQGGVPSGYGAPQAPQGYGAPQPAPTFGAPQPTLVAAPPNFGAPPQAFGSPQPQGYGSPQPQGYGAPQPQGFGSPWPDASQGGYGNPNPYTAPQGAPYGGQYSPYRAPDGVQAVQHPQAIVALILGAVSWFFGLWLICSIPAWVIGARAVREIDANPGRYTGRTEAMVGKWLGIVMTFLGALVVLAVVVFISVFASQM